MFEVGSGHSYAGDLVEPEMDSLSCVFTPYIEVNVLVPSCEPLQFYDPPFRSLGHVGKSLVADIETEK